jgi:hypothetical protein
MEPRIEKHPWNRGRTETAAGAIVEPGADLLTLACGQQFATVLADPP